MGLQCGIIGITNTGKTTLFNCISNTRAEASSFAFSANKSNIGRVIVPDKRLYAIDEIIKSAKVKPAIIDIVDIPGLTKGSHQGEGVGNQFLADIRNTDALIHVVRCFEDNNLVHIEETIDPVRDKETIDFELQIKDLESLEKKILKIEKLVKTGDKKAVKDLKILNIYKDHISNFQTARSAPVSGDDKKVISDLALLTAKPVIYVCNVDAKSAVSGNKFVDQFKEAVKGEDSEILIIAAGLESEISELENEEDRKIFLEDAGLSEPGVNKLVNSAYRILNLQSFFTMGPKEVRAWTIIKGSTAQQAAGTIHSDLERGFIRTEVIKYDDFMNLKSEQACKQAGKMHVEGKNYIVENGDIMYIRFNV